MHWCCTILKIKPTCFRGRLLKLRKMCNIFDFSPTDEVFQYFVFAFVILTMKIK